jgi:putative oxidoreductase
MSNFSTITPDQSIHPIRVTKALWPQRLVALLATDDSLAPAVLRIALGGVVLGHGLQKVFGWFGGYGISGTMGFFASLGIPAPLGALVIVSDFLGSIALIIGLATRFSAAAAAAVMLGALAMVHWSNGFFMNWAGAPHGEGFELHVLAIGMALALMLSGGGRASLDRRLLRWTRAR